MTSKHSRSEIEAALTSKPKTQGSGSANQAKAQDMHLEHGRRRQQVIGGNLTGVANRRNTGFLTKIMDINLVNWIAAGIVLLILLAFFWPSTESSAVREIPAAISNSDTDLIHNQNKQDSIGIDAPTVQSFSRETDLRRADGFREQEELERQVSELLAVATAQVGRGAYTIPDGDNAIKTYRDILLISPNNAKAEKGMEYIRGRILETGLSALQKGDSRAASLARAKLAKIDVDAVEVIQLDETIAQWRLDRQVGQLMSKATDALAQENLILPPRDNALYYFQQILELDENNSSAKGGITAIADNFIEQANTAINIGRLDSATSYLATVSVIEPDHPSLSLLEETIKKATPIARELNARANVAQSTEPTSPSQPGAESSPSSGLAAQARPTSPSTNTGLQSQSDEQELLDRQFLARGLEAYYKGEYDEAASFLQPLADKGISRAQFRIGYMYYQGRGFEVNRNEADRIIRAALPAIQKFADEGRSWAQSDIGSLYEDGLVLPRDYGEAVFWYRLAAEQGYPGAQTNLGIMYALGRGVPASRRTAIDWFQQAATQGDILAKRNLESLGITE